MQGPWLPMDVPVRTLEGHAAAVQSVVFSREGRYCISASQDKTLRLWNPHNGLCVKEYKGPHNHEVSGVAVTGDNTRFASCGGDKVCFLWDVSSGQVIRKFSGHDRKVNAIAFDPGESVLLTGSNDKSVRIWDLKSRSHAPIQVLADAKDSVLCLCIHNNEIIAGSVDGAVRRYDIRAGQLTVDDMLQPVSSVGLSGDGNCLLISTLDSCVRLLEKDTGTELASYRGHTNQRFRVQSTLDPTDSYVVSGSEDNTVCLWELVEAKLLKSLRGHEGPVLSACFHGGTLLTGAGDGSVKVWQVAGA